MTGEIEPRTFKVGASRTSREEADNTRAPFTLAYEVDGETHEEQFVAYPKRMPQATLMKIPNMRVDANSVAMFAAFRSALCGPLEHPDGDEAQPLAATYRDYDRFEKLVQRDDVLVEAEQLGEILGWFSEVATGRPTTPS